MARELWRAINLLPHSPVTTLARRRFGERMLLVFVPVSASLFEVTSRHSSPESSPTVSSINEAAIEAMLLVGTNDGAKLKDDFFIPPSVDLVVLLSVEISAVITSSSFFEDGALLGWLLETAFFFFFFPIVFVNLKGVLVAAVNADGFAN